MPPAPIEQPTLDDFQAWLDVWKSDPRRSERLDLPSAEKMALAAAQRRLARSRWGAFVGTSSPERFFRMCAWVFPKMPDDAKKSRMMTDSLSLAAVNGLYEPTAWLVENLPGPRVDQGALGDALSFAAESHQPEIVALLLSKGCNPDASPRAGYTPLFLALDEYKLNTESYDRALQTAQILVGAGAKLEITIMGERKTAISVAHGSVKGWLKSIREKAKIGKSVAPAAALPKLPRRRF